MHHCPVCLKEKCYLYQGMCSKQGPTLRELCLHFWLRTFRKGTESKLNKQLCWINLATVVAGLMKSKLTESQHIDICKPINLLNKKWGDKNPPQTTKQNI